MTTHAADGYRSVDMALAEQRCVILDGGVATELPHRHGQDHETLWGIESLASSPEAVRAVHASYVDAGATVISTNTWALPVLLNGGGQLEGGHGPPVHWMEIARRGVRLARDAAADAAGGRPAVALTLNGDIDDGDGGEAVSLIMRAVAAEPPDLILLETLSLLRPSLDEVVRALVETSIPVWLSFRRCRHGLCGVYGQHWGGPEGDAFGRAARRFEEMGAAALLVNCIPPDHIAGVVSYLRDFTDLTLGVYPNLGYHTTSGWEFTTEIGGPEYAEMARRWRDEGAQIVGGCCGTRPEHIAAARRALEGTLPGHERPAEGSVPTLASQPSDGAGPTWRSRRGRQLFPLDFPQLNRPRAEGRVIPGSYLLWRHLFEEGTGAHQRCLDIGSGTGLQTVQLALNGAAHVHAIDVDESAVAETLDSAFRNGVAERVTAEASDLYPWVPKERYELVVACLPQVPVPPVSQRSSHRPADYWGRGLVDQVIAKLPSALALEGRALVTMTSLLSRLQTIAAVASAGLSAEVVAWEIQDLPESYRAQRDHIALVQERSDGHLLEVGGRDAIVCYLLELRHRAAGEPEPAPATVDRR